MIPPNPLANLSFRRGKVKHNNNYLIILKPSILFIKRYTYIVVNYYYIITEIILQKYILVIIMVEIETKNFKYVRSSYTIA